MSAIPLPVNLTGPVGFAQWVGIASEGWYWIVILLAVTIISISWMAQFGIAKAFASTFFFMTSIALIMRFLELIGDNIVFIYVILLSASVLMLFIMED